MKPHGTRTRYFYHGCRCELCREANARYQRERRRVGPQIVLAEPARLHILKLSEQGVGRRRVAALAGVNEHTVLDIRTGARDRIFLKTEKAILAVTAGAPADGAHIDGDLTLERITKMLDPEIGLTKKHLARRLGSQAKVPQLQIYGPKVTARNEAKVETLYRRIMTGQVRPEDLPKNGWARPTGAKGFHYFLSRTLKSDCASYDYDLEPIAECPAPGDCCRLCSRNVWLREQAALTRSVKEIVYENVRRGPQP